MKASISRNKREGYYAGHYRPNDDFARTTKPKAWRWSWFAMHEFYPPVWGSPWKVLENKRDIFVELMDGFDNLENKHEHI